MRTYEPWMSSVLFQCEPLNIDTRKDLWSSKCGVGCGQGRDFSCTFNYLLNSFTRLFSNPKKVKVMISTMTAGQVTATLIITCK